MKTDKEWVEEFNCHYNLFLWFRGTRRAWHEELSMIRAGQLKVTPTQWSLIMQRCGYCKRRMAEQIEKMEHLVRPISPYLQRKYP